jgi:hypothetical protein
MGWSPDGAAALEGLDILIDVAENVWLPHQRDRRQDTSDRLASQRHRAEQRARLSTLVARHQQVAELDARIALLEITPGVPERDRHITRLRQLRKKLVSVVRSS